MAPDNQDAGSLGSRLGTAGQARAGVAVVNFQFPDPVSTTGPNPPPEINRWCIGNNIPLYESNNPQPIAALNQGQVVTVKQSKVQVSGDTLNPTRFWSQIEYQYYDPKDWSQKSGGGWIDERYLDDYVEEFPSDMPGNRVGIGPNLQTKNPFDAQQYILWGGQSQPQYDMCGEFCVAFVLGQNIETVLKTWENATGKSATIFSSGTTADQVKDFFRKAAPDSVFTDFSAASTTLDRKNMLEMLKTNCMVIRVRSNVGPGGDGELLDNRGNDQRNHWVVVNAITHQGNCVEIYNPFPNRRETFAYLTFTNSCSAPMLSGFWVQRKEALPASSDGPQDQGYVPQVGIEPPAPDQGTMARQYIRVNGARKTELCGEFCVSYILTQSIDCILDYLNQKMLGMPEITTILDAYGFGDAQGFGIRSVLKRWQNSNPAKYNQFVGQNNSTGIGDLKTILTAYGYTDDDLMVLPQDFRDITSPNDPRYDRFYVPPTGLLEEKLETHFLIAGVGIDSSAGPNSGRLKSLGGTRHWEVVEEIHATGRHYKRYQREGDGGWVRIYNPFTNQMEEYSLLEFINSIGGPEGERGWVGLYVKRIPSFVEGRTASTPSGRTGFSGSSGGQPGQTIAQVAAQKLNDLERLSQYQPETAAVDAASEQEEVLAKDLALKIATVVRPILDSQAAENQ